MKWFWNHCRWREEVSLLAAGVLTGEGKITVERHLADCLECRTYYNGLRETTALLAGLEKNLSSIEATQAMRTRWSTAIRSDTSNASPWGAGLLRTVWRELIWPSRYAWSGFVALWLAMLIVNARTSDHSMGRTSSSPQEIMQALEEEDRVFAEWTRPSGIAPAAPAYIPRPRSQKDEDWAVI